MALSDAQLKAIKTKIENDKISPMEAIRTLFPKENPKEVRKFLFAKYDKVELREHKKNK